MNEIERKPRMKRSISEYVPLNLEDCMLLGYKFQVKCNDVVTITDNCRRFYVTFVIEPINIIYTATKNAITADIKNTVESPNCNQIKPAKTLAIIVQIL